MKFSKALRHIDIADVKRKRLEEVAVKKLKEERLKEERQDKTLKDIVHDILFEGERKKEYVIPRVLLHAIWGELK